MKHFTFLCVILALHGFKRVVADSSLSKQNDLMEKMNEVVDIYNEMLDKNVQWNGLNKAVESIEILFRAYDGKAKNNMQALLSENIQAHDEYLFAVGPLYQWCGSVKNDLPHTLTVIRKPNLSNSARLYIKDRTTALLLRGVEQSKDSIHHIQLAIQHMSQLGILLNVTEWQMNEDFSSKGYYGIERSKLASELEKHKSISGALAGVLALFGVLCTALLTLAMGPVGLAIGLSGTLVATGIPLAVLYGHTKPSIEQQITIIDVFYKKLEDELILAKRECKKIDRALKTKLSEINRLATDIRTPQPMDVMIPEFSSLFVDSLNKLTDSCKRYIESHGSTTSRRRRAAVAQMLPMTPVNYTFYAGMLLNENHGVIHETVFANLKQFVSDPLISHLL